MRNTNKLSIVNPGPLLTLLLACTIHASVAVAEVHLDFGIYTAEKPTTMVKTVRPLLSELEYVLGEKLGESVNISLQVVSTYEAGIDALVDGEVDFSLLGPAPYVAAKEREDGIRILALDSKDDSKTFNGVICVAQDSPIVNIDGLRGKMFAFGNKKSTIGRYLSQQYLLEHDIAASDLAGFDYLGRHDRVGHAVSQGEFDAGALRESTFNRLRESGLALRALAVFPNVNRPWVARAGLDGKLFDALRHSMLTLSAREAFRLLGRKKFVAGTDADFHRIRMAVQKNSEFFETASMRSPVTTSEQ